MSNSPDPALNGIAKSCDDRRSEEALRRSEARYRALVEASSQAVWSWSPADGTGDFDATQRWWEQLTGQTPEEQQGSHTKWLEVVHPDDRETAGAAWGMALATGVPYDVEYRVRAREGGWRFVKARGIPIPGPDGTPREWVGTLHDVTDRWRAEQAAAASRERLTAALKAARMCAFTWDPAADATVASDTIADVFGLHPGETIDSSRVGFGLIHPDDVDRHRELLRRAAERGESWHTELRIIRPVDGRVAWLEERATAERDATGAVRMTGLVWDVTERKVAEAESAQLAEKLRLALDAGDLGTWEWDPTTDGMTLSPRAGEIYGLAPGVPHGREAGRRLIHPDDRERARRAAARAVAERSDYDIEYRLAHRPVWVAAHGRGEYDAVGNLVRMHGVVQDVTARKEAEEALRASEERHRALVTATADVVYRMSADWEVMHPADGRGLVPGNAEPIRGWMDANLPASEHPRVREAIRHAIESKGGFELEHRVNRPDGSVGWALSRAVPITDAAGQIAEWFGTARDVTDRKAAQDELARVTAESERRKRLFETALSNTPDLVFVFGLDRRFAYANEALLAMWGRTWDEAIGRTCLELGYEPWQAARHDAEVDQVAATGRPVHGEVPFTGTHGRRVYDYIFAPVFGAGGEVEAVAGTARDTTDRKRAEDAVRESEGRFRTLFDSMDQGFCVIEVTFEGGRAADHRFVELNPAFERHSGLSRDLLGKSVREAVPGLEEFWFDTYARVAATGEPIRFAHHAAPLGRWFEVYAFRLTDPDRHRVAVLFTDVSDRKRAEEAQRDAGRKKDEFIALLAHELRNPLAPVRNGLQVLRLSLDPAARERAQAVMDRQLTHMVRLIDDLLDVSRITQNKMELRRGRVPLADVVGSAVEAARPVIDEAGHELTVSLPDRPVHLDADLTRLAQVFSNLLTNSAKYTPRGGRVWLSAERSDGRVVVTVRDTGIGIPKESLPAIFDMFSQVDRSVEKSTGGLGIGLALVKGLVEMHGGTVTVASDGGGTGTSFTVTLSEAERPESPDPIAPEVPARTPARRILVVDDNRDGAESMADMLGLLGHEVAAAHDGLEAVERAEAIRPDVILMDVGMPRLNGLDATRRIREQPWGRGIAVVALTGWGQENDREKSREAGCDAHLVKPVGLADLERLLAELPHGRTS